MVQKLLPFLGFLKYVFYRSMSQQSGPGNLNLYRDGLQAGRLRNQGSIPRRGIRFFSSLQRPYPFYGAHPVYYITGTEGPISAVKAIGV